MKAQNKNSGKVIDYQALNQTYNTISRTLFVEGAPVSFGRYAPGTYTEPEAEELDEFEKFAQWAKQVRKAGIEAAKDKRGGIHKYVDKRYRKW